MAGRIEGVELSCSFCGKRHPAVKLIAVPRVTICSECVASCAEIAREHPGRTQSRAELTRVADRQSIFSRLRSRIFRTSPAVEPTCSFCGRTEPPLVQPPTRLGTQALICGRCLALCQDLVAGHFGGVTP
jgi:hypothetical protein